MRRKRMNVRLIPRVALKHLFVLAIVVLIIVQDNSGPNQFQIREQKKSPYGLGFLERYGETAKNFVADRIKLTLSRTGPLSPENYLSAKTAWQYFERNIHKQTGLVNGIDGRPVTTMWDQASALSAMYYARRFELIDATGYEKMLTNMLESLQTMELVNNQVPNKYYNSINRKMVRFSGVEDKAGYSPIDIGRLLIWLKVTKEMYPEFAASIDRITLRWNYCNLIDGGQMFGGSYDRNGNLRIFQQGRLGYEEYAAKGFYLWGFDTSIASKALPVRNIEVEHFAIPVDARDFLDPVEKSFVVPDSYLLDGLEFNWDKPDDLYTDKTVHSDVFSAQTADNIYRAQQKRFETTGLPTAKSEYQLASKPWFVYDTIYANGYAWNTIDDLGTSISNYAALSTKAAFAMWALWDTPYTDLLLKTVRSLYDDGFGYKEGIFEVGNQIPARSSNTNAMILASLGYKVFGKAVASDSQQGLWEFVLKSHLIKQSNDQCYPLRYVCTENCDRIDSFSNKGIAQTRLKEVEARLEQLESSRQLQLKAFETVQ